MFHSFFVAAKTKALGIFLCLVLFGMFFSARHVLFAQTSANNPPVRSAIVLGIINYTRWPSLGPSIRFCFLGDSDFSEELKQLSPFSERMTGHGMLYSAAKNDEGISRACDLVYVGKVQDADIKEFARNVGNAPVLTIGEKENACSLGVMFCLSANPGSDGAGFSANLDAISRNSLRINPQVLKLSSRLKSKGVP